MPRPPVKPFCPPTPDQVASYLARHFVTGPSPWVRWQPMILLGMVLFLTLTWSSQSTGATGLLTLLIWMSLLGFFFWSIIRTNAMKQVEQQLSNVQEFTLRRNHVQALRVVWKLIPQLRAMPQMHARAVALLAHNLQFVRAFDASAVAFGHVIDKLPEDHPASLQLRVEQVMTLLASDQLTDADNTLRKLRFVLDRFPGTVISAGYTLGELYQRVRTNHFQDILDSRSGVTERLRPLGIDAAPGYAMLALACFHMRHTDAQLLSQAVMWWDRASLLMSPRAMVERFEELAVIERGPAVVAGELDVVDVAGGMTEGGGV